MFCRRCITVLVLTVMGVTACASSPKKPLTLEEELAERHYYVSEPVEEILQYRIDGWNYIDRRHVILQTGPADHYLVSLINPCHGLSSAEDIAFSTTVGRLTKHDSLLVKGAGGILERCHIGGLDRLEETDR